MSSSPASAFRIRKPFSTSKRGRRPGDTAIGLSNSAPSISLLFLLLNLLITLLSKDFQARTDHIKRPNAYTSFKESDQSLCLHNFISSLSFFSTLERGSPPLRTTNLSIAQLPPAQMTLQNGLTD